MPKYIQQGVRMSQAVVHGDTNYIAGQVGAPGENAKTQTRAILAKIEELLKATQSDKNNMLMATIWLADMADFASMNSVWDEWFTGFAAPARATVQAKLATPDYRVEISMVAAVGSASNR
jgi:enamine deaminase RidA (YjgF/YER057c/UK114 family)